jgi:hypothetical protein
MWGTTLGFQLKDICGKIYTYKRRLAGSGVENERSIKREKKAPLHGEKRSGSFS